MRRLLLLLFWLVALPSHAEIHLRVALEALHEDVARRIAAGQYESVLRDADRYLATKERLSDGRWKLAILYGGLDIGYKRAAHTPEEWERRAAELQALAKRHPHSANGWLMVAQLEASRGWAARGEGYASTARAEDLAVFEARIEKERQLLEDHPVPTNPEWNDMRIQAAADSGAPQADLDRLFAMAIEREPGYQQNWFTRLNYARPAWGGSNERMVALINQAGGVTSPTEGRGMMGRLLQIAMELGESRLIDSPKIDWNAVKASYEDVLKRYPDDWNAQWFFFQASMHGDKAEAKHLLTFVKEPPSPALLGSNVRAYLVCVDWAEGKVPGFVTRDATTGAEKFIE